MRQLHDLAVLLGCTVGHLMRTLSAQEFTRWVHWMRAEQRGAAWDRLRHAELMAATYNAGGLKHPEDRAFGTADFMDADPWGLQPAPPRPPQATPEQLQRLHQVWLRQQGE